MPDDSISFMESFSTLSHAIDFTLVDWVIFLLMIGSISWVLYQRRRATDILDPPEPGIENPEVPDADHQGHTDTELPPEPDEDEELVKQNPGHHAAVIRLIVKAETVEEIDSLFDNYINSASHHKAYEIDVVTTHYLKKSHLLKGQERMDWYSSERAKIPARYGYADKQFIKSMSDTWKKYPALADWD